MPDFQGQFIPDGRILICKEALTIALGFDSGNSKDASVNEERRHLEDVYTWIRSDKYCGPVPEKEL